MKRIFLISVLIIGICALLLGGPTAPATAEPKGEIVYTVPSLGFENFGLAQSFDVGLLGLVYEHLFRTHWNGLEPVGLYNWVAERYEVSDDGITYDIFLNKGIQFHEGWGEVTAEDLVFTFDQVKDPANESDGNFYFAPPDHGGYIKSYEAVDKYHFRVHMSRTYNLFIMDNCDPFLPILCKKYIEKVGWEKAKEHPIGTSPYKHVETVPGDYIKLEAVENHWRKTGEFKYITLKFVPETSSQIMMLKSGQADMAMIAPEKVEEVKAAGLKIMDIPGLKYVSVMFGGQLLPTRETYDPTVPWAMHTDEPENSEWNERARKVRKAMCMAINVPAIIDKIFYGYAYPESLRDITRENPDFLPEWKPYPYDLEQAKKLLAEAGYAKGFEKPVQVLIPSTPPFAIDTKRMMEAVAGDFEAVGIKVESRVIDQLLIDQEWRDGWDSAWKVTSGVGFSLIIPRWGFPWSRASFAPFHELGECPTFDKFTNEALETLVPKEITKAVQGLFNYQYYNYMERGICAASAIFAFGPKIKGMSRLPLHYEHIQNSPITLNYEYLERAD